MNDFHVHAAVGNLINAFRDRGFSVRFSNDSGHMMLVRGSNNKGPYDASIKFESILTAKAWLEGYDYATKPKKGNAE